MIAPRHTLDGGHMIQRRTNSASCPGISANILGWQGRMKLVWRLYQSIIVHRLAGIFWWRGYELILNCQHHLYLSIYPFIIMAEESRAYSRSSGTNGFYQRMWYSNISFQHRDKYVALCVYLNKMVESHLMEHW